MNTRKYILAATDHGGELVMPLPNVLFLHKTCCPESAPESYHQLCTMGVSVSMIPHQHKAYSTQRRYYDNDSSNSHDSRCA
jgi:hypothetical protein